MRYLRDFPSWRLAAFSLGAVAVSIRLQESIDPDSIANTNKHANPVDGTSRPSEFHDEKRIAPNVEPSTGANPELPVHNAQARLLVLALQHQVLGDQQRPRPESGRNARNEKANRPTPSTNLRH
jgi:hypothetical protein